MPSACTAHRVSAENKNVTFHPISVGNTGSNTCTAERVRMEACLLCFRHIPNPQPRTPAKSATTKS